MADEKGVSVSNPAQAVNTPPIPTKNTRNESGNKNKSGNRSK